MDKQQEYFKYLDNLRESGTTNMFGAGRYLQNVFSELSRKDAHKILQEWMNSYKDS
jgi:hypothetical protein